CRHGRKPGKVHKSRRQGNSETCHVPPSENPRKTMLWFYSRRPSWSKRNLLWTSGSTFGIGPHSNIHRLPRKVAPGIRMNSDTAVGERMAMRRCLILSVTTFLMLGFAQSARAQIGMSAPDQPKQSWFLRLWPFHKKAPEPAPVIKGPVESPAARQARE